MREFIKANLRVLPVTLLLCTISVYAAGTINARDVSYYDNGKVTDVEQAIATLYDGIEIGMVTPVGAVLPYMGTSAPDQYLICDGSVYNIADYQKLADHIKNNFGSYNKFGGNGTTTFAVPDLRGEFLRGAGTNGHANQGSGSTVGVHQNATLHVYASFYTNGNGDQWIGYTKNFTNPTNVDGTYNNETRYINGQNSGNYANSTIPRSYSSRPTNTSVNYIIKVR